MSCESNIYEKNKHEYWHKFIFVEILTCFPFFFFFWLNRNQLNALLWEGDYVNQSIEKTVKQTPSIKIKQMLHCSSKTLHFATVSFYFIYIHFNILTCYFDVCSVVNCVCGINKHKNRKHKNKILHHLIGWFHCLSTTIYREKKCGLNNRWSLFWILVSLSNRTWPMFKWQKRLLSFNYDNNIL